jgi:hypothetical protein
MLPGQRKIFRDTHPSLLSLPSTSSKTIHGSKYEIPSPQSPSWYLLELDWQLKTSSGDEATTGKSTFFILVERKV